MVMDSIMDLDHGNGHRMYTMIPWLWTPYIYRIYGVYIWYIMIPWLWPPYICRVYTLYTPYIYPDPMVMDALVTWFFTQHYMAV